MARIIVFGDIDISPLYLTLDDYREITLAGKWPLCLYVEAGYHSIAATTITKFQRSVKISNDSFLGWAANAMTNGTNTSIAGQIELEDDEILLLQVKNHLTKPCVYNRVVSESEAERYLDMDSVVNYGERAPGEKNKWVAFFLCLFLGFLGAHRFYEGKIATGILYLCTLGLGGIGVIVDLIRIWQRSGSAAPASERAADPRPSSVGGAVLTVMLVVLAVAVLGAVLLSARSSLTANRPTPLEVTDPADTLSPGEHPGARPRRRLHLPPQRQGAHRPVGGGVPVGQRVKLCHQRDLRTARLHFPQRGVGGVLQPMPLVHPHHSLRRVFRGLLQPVRAAELEAAGGRAQRPKERRLSKTGRAPPTPPEHPAGQASFPPPPHSLSHGG